MTQKQFLSKIKGFTIWRILAYFIIYSVIGYIIETIYPFILYGTIESRKSFLYGPFCSIYGVGAVVMIIALQYFKKNNYTLFAGGFLVGSIVEYAVSLIGELILDVRWWDYSNRFLNLNGRISFIYSVFWGFLGLYLIKSVNPQVDRFLNWIKTKVNNIKAGKVIIAIITIAMFIDCVISALAINAYLTRQTVTNNLDVKDKQKVIAKYENIYGNEKYSQFIQKHWNDEVMIKAYPNLTIKLKDDSLVYVKNLLTDLKPYYYKFEK